MLDTDTKLHEELREIRRDIRELHHELYRYKGFVGGVVWAFAALSAGAHLLYNWISRGGTHT